MPGTNIKGQVSSALWLREVDERGYALSAVCTGTPPTTANMFNHGCQMIQTDTTTGTAATYQNTGSLAAPVWTLFDTSLPGDTASELVDTNSEVVVDVATVASQVNHLRVTPSATGVVTANAVTIAPVGDDAAVSLSIEPKAATGIVTIGLATGTGDIVVGSSSAAQAVKIADGVGAATVEIANETLGGATINMVAGPGGPAAVDVINIASGTTDAAGLKTVNLMTGAAVTPGSNRMLVGSDTLSSSTTFNSVVLARNVTNYIATEGGANNAITATLLNSVGVAIPTAAGLEVTLQLAHTLQAGANTFDLNGGGGGGGVGPVAIKSHLNVANDIAAPYAATGVIKLFYNGTVWLDMSQ